VSVARLLYLDNLRSFALLLGIIFHAAIVYASKIGYAIQNTQRLDSLSYFCFWIHSFRMPLFFLISGYFSALVWEKKGKNMYIEGRIFRIFIPMALGLLLLSPIQYFLMSLIKSPDLKMIVFLERFFTPQSFAHSHIWFLVDLLIFSILFILTPKQFLKNIATYIDRSLIPIGIVFVTFVWSLTLFSHAFFPRGDSFYGIDKLTFFYQLGFFISGLFIYYLNILSHFRDHITTIDLLTWLCLGIFVFLIFYQLETSDPLWMPYFYGRILIRGLHLFVWCISPFVWAIFFHLLFKKYFNFTNVFTVYLIDSSLPIYLLHHPISLITAFYFRGLDIPVMTKFGLHTIIVISLSFFLYDTFIKNTIILRKLFGLK
jgi:glucan biosynthesis protein C